MSSSWSRVALLTIYRCLMPSTLSRKLKPKVAILTHFGMTMWRAKPWEIAQKMSEETGVKVIAARDGMKFDLSQLDNA